MLLLLCLVRFVFVIVVVIVLVFVLVLVAGPARPVVAAGVVDPAAQPRRLRHGCSRREHLDSIFINAIAARDRRILRLWRLSAKVFGIVFGFLSTASVAAATAGRNKENTGGQHKKKTDTSDNRSNSSNTNNTDKDDDDDNDSSNRNSNSYNNNCGLFCRARFIFKFIVVLLSPRLVF